MSIRENGLRMVIKRWEKKKTILKEIKDFKEGVICQMNAIGIGRAVEQNNKKVAEAASVTS